VTGLRDPASEMGLRAGAGPFARGLLEVAAQREDVVAVTADLTKYTDLSAFREAYPERTVNVGVAEQNLVAVASGIQMAGLKPVVTTFAVFLTRRAFDLVAMQVALHGADMMLACSLVGICSTFGPSHQGIDDLAHMRVLPGVTLLDPCDPVEMQQATRWAVEHEGPVYLRMLLDGEEQVLDPAAHRFEPGRARLLRSGEDVGIVASSILVPRALEAARELDRQGVAAAVLKVSSLRPFDHAAVAELAARCGRIVTAENHSLVGGLRTLVCETLADARLAVGLRSIGVDGFGDFGTRPYVARRQGLTTEAVVDAALALVGERPA
jgi:transketolase